MITFTLNGFQKVIRTVSVYCAAKAGVNSLTKSTALELAEHKIRCNAVCPGVTMTPLLGTVPPELVQEVVDKTPLKNILDPKGE